MPSNSAHNFTQSITNFTSSEESDFLSPMDRDQLQYDGTIYSTFYHAWLASILPTQEEILEIIQKESRKIVYIANDYIFRFPEKQRPGWKKESDKILSQLVAQKFGIIAGAPDYRMKLLSGFKLARTDPAPLVYRVFNCDNYLGICDCNNCKKDRVHYPELGENRLGRKYEEVRAALLGTWDGDPFDDTCFLCWSNKVKVPKEGVTRFIEWNKDGFSQFPACWQHRDELEKQIKNDGGPYFRYEITTTPSYSSTSGASFGSSKASTSSGCDWYQPAGSTTVTNKKSWGATIWHMSDDTEEVFEVTA